MRLASSGCCACLPEGCVSQLLQLLLSARLFTRFQLNQQLVEVIPTGNCTQDNDLPCLLADSLLLLWPRLGLGGQAVLNCAAFALPVDLAVVVVVLPSECPPDCCNGLVQRHKVQQCHETVLITVCRRQGAERHGHKVALV